MQRQLACWKCYFEETYGYDGNQSGIIIAEIGSSEKMDVVSENGVFFFSRQWHDCKGVNQTTWKKICLPMPSTVISQIRWGRNGENQKNRKIECGAREERSKRSSSASCEFRTGQGPPWWQEDVGERVPADASHAWLVRLGAPQPTQGRCNDGAMTAAKGFSRKDLEGGSYLLW